MKTIRDYEWGLCSGWLCLKCRHQHGKDKSCIKGEQNGQQIKSKKAKKVVPPKRRTDLRSVLQSIYHDTVNLETTCNHQCECCKVAMPQINYSEFIQIISNVWKRAHEEVIEVICTSLEYFFRYEYEKWGMATMVKPCMLLDGNNMCSVYEDRPLSCRLYGLWPREMYENRVDKFAKAYERYGLKREDLPLNTQCPYVKRKDDSVALTPEIIQGLYDQLDKLDQTVGSFSNAQIRQKENYRTFHDWLLLKVLGEDWLSLITTFILAADKDMMEDQIAVLKNVIRTNFQDTLPSIENIVKEH